MKVICAGLSKTGTKSMAEALRILGYNVYDAPETVTYHTDMWVKVLDGEIDAVKSFKTMYEQVDAVTDLPPCAYWDLILEAFPQSKVILMLRDNEEQWIRSMKTQAATLPVLFPPEWLWRNLSMHMTFCWMLSPTLYNMWNNLAKSSSVSLGMFPTRFKKVNEQILRTFYRRHEVYVKSVCKENNLLVFNVKQGWEPVCKFLGKEIPDQPFPHINRNASVSKGEIDEQFEIFNKRVKNEIVERLKIFGVVVLASFLALLLCFLF